MSRRSINKCSTVTSDEVRSSLIAEEGKGRRKDKEIGWLWESSFMAQAGPARDPCVGRFEKEKYKGFVLIHEVCTSQGPNP